MRQAGVLTNKNNLLAGERGKYTNITPRGHFPAAAFVFSTRGTQAEKAINECRLMELPVFGVVNTAVHQPSIMYPIPCNDVAGSSFNLLMGAMQGMMLRVDMLQKKRLLMMILMEVSLKNQIQADLQSRRSGANARGRRMKYEEMTNGEVEEGEADAAAKAEYREMLVNGSQYDFTVGEVESSSAHVDSKKHNKKTKL